VVALNPAVVFARVFVDELVRNGLDHAVLAPGSRSAPLAMALATEDRLRLHVRIDERSAAFLALGLGKAGGSPAAVLCTSGTAAANFHPAVLEAHEARVPLLVLTADRPPELRGTGANQTVDQIKLYGDAVRWFCEVGAPHGVANDYWRSLACRAWAEAAGLVGRPPGPVHLNLAFREPLVPDGTEDTPAGRPEGAAWTTIAAPTRQPSAEDMAWLAESIERVERGLVVLGDSDRDLGSLVALARAARWPVIAEPSSNARTGDEVISTASLLLADGDFAAQHTPDLILSAGRVGLSRAVLGLLARAPELVRVDPPGGWLDPTRSTSRLIVADPESLPVPEGRDRSGWQESWCEAERAARGALDALLDEDEAPSEPRTARDLAATVPDGGLLVVSSSMPIRDLDLTMRPRAGLRVLANRGASGIDGVVSTAVGAALRHDGPAFALLGDLALLHDQNGLLIGTEQRPDLVLVVANNDGGGIFSLLPQAGVEGFERVFGTPHGADLAHVAAATGCVYVRVARAADLPAAVAGARGLTLVEVRTDRTANAVLHARMREQVATISRYGHLD
jgi:2-succinyl-5-enolpyruvyl-6-hydroxy-3-cyclohexene-1-carboxylate synthase